MLFAPPQHPFGTPKSANLCRPPPPPLFTYRQTSKRLKRFPSMFRLLLGGSYCECMNSEPSGCSGQTLVKPGPRTHPTPSFPSSPFSRGGKLIQPNAHENLFVAATVGLLWTYVHFIFGLCLNSEPSGCSGQTLVKPGPRTHLNRPSPLPPFSRGGKLI